jgi:YVTN family beta-propeller protein
MNDTKMTHRSGAARMAARSLVRTAILLAWGVFPIAAQTANNPNPSGPGQPASIVLRGAAQLVSHADPSQMMRLVFALQPPHLAEEKQFVQDVQTKGNPLFHRFLTQAQWIARFAPAAEEEQALVDWATSQGFTISNRYPNRMLVNVEAPLRTIENALQVQVNNYRAGADMFYSNDRAPSIPAHLSAIVQEVLGMNSLAMLQPMSVGLHASPPVYVPGPLVTRGPSRKVSASAPKPHAKSGITGGFYDPTDIYASYAYDYDALQNLGHCCNPTGNPNGPTPVTSIGVATAYDINLSDMDGFIAQYPYLAWNLDQVYIGGQVSCPGNNPSCNKETTLDLEWATATSNSFGSVYDTAAIWAYEGSNSLVSTFLSIYQQMLSDDHVNIVSISWGCSESCTGTSYMNSVDNAFLQMIGEGWTIFAASGDQGATEGCTSQDAVNNPASDPNVIAVGGTALQTGPNGFSSEVGWTGGTAQGSCAGNNGGSGGGISGYWGVPSYQTALGFTQRELPDVALNAAIGQNIFYNGTLQGIGGTSIATPEMAGFMAQENAYLLSLGKVCAEGNYPCAPAGNITNTIYRAGTNPSAFNHYPFYDIVSGCNSNDITLQYGLPFYCAAAGWDAVTGWGSPNMLQLAWLINAAATDSDGLPIVAISGPAINKWYNQDETVKWTISENSLNGYPTAGIAGYSAQWDSDPGDIFSEANPGPATGNSFYTGPQVPNATSGTLDFTGSGVQVGCHTANVRAFDNTGLESYDVTYGPVCYDNVPPSTNLETSSTEAPVTVTLESIDVGSGVAKTLYKLDSGSWTTYKGPFTVSALGTHTISFYSVDVAGNQESTQTQTFPVLGGTTTALTSSPNPSTYSAAVTFTAKVTSPSGTPTGTVKFYNGATVMGSASLSGGVATFSTATLAGGSHSISADYEGSAKFLPSTSNTVTQTVNPATTNTTVMSSLNPSSVGQSVTFTATVNSSGGTPTGKVTFTFGSTTLGTVTLTNGVGSITTSALPSGRDSVVAKYAGTTDFTASTGSIIQVVESGGANTTTTVVSGEPYNPAGHTVTFTATVTATTGTPTGSVTFLYNNDILLGTENLVNGSAQVSTSSLPAGTVIVEAYYNGGSGFNPSSATVQQMTVGVTNVGTDPLAVLSDGSNLWVSNNGSNSVSKVQESTGTVLATVSVGKQPEGLAYDGTNVWVANYGSNSVSVINVASASVVATYAAGTYPGALAYDGSHIWVSSYGTNTLTVLNQSNGVVVNTYTFGSPTFGLGALFFDYTNIWVSVSSINSVVKILASTGAVEGTYSAGSGPGAMAYDGTNLWIANYGANTLTKMLASNGSIVGTVSVSNPSGVTYDGTNLWVSNYLENTVTGIVAGTGASLGAFEVGEGPVGITWDGFNIWVAVSVTDTIVKF